MLEYQNPLKLIPYLDRGGIKSKLSHSINVNDIRYLHIEAHAGIGKTRLVSEIINEVKSKRYIYYYMSPQESLHTNGFIQDILKNFIGKFDATSFLSSCLLGTKSEYEAILKETITYGIPLYTHTNLIIENFICDFLLHLSKTKEIILVVEDVHWADEGRNSFLKKILVRLENSENKNICFITTSREPTDYEHLSITESIKLDSLTFEDSEKLIKSCTIDHLSFNEYAEDLALFAQGNPYFINETINLLSQRASHDNLDTNLPRSFLDIFKFQLDTLNSLEEKIMLASSVIGFTVKRKEIAALLPEVEPYIDSALKSLMATGHLLAAGDDLETFKFQHILKKENFYSLVDRENRMAWHYTLYKYYQSQNIKNIKNKFELCGYHAFQAEAYNEAPRYLWYCGQKALQLSEPQKAAFLFSDFLKCSQEKADIHPNTIIRVNLERCRAFLMQGNVKIAENSLAGIRSVIANFNLTEEDKQKWNDQISTLKILLLWLNGSFDKKDLLSLRSSSSYDNDLDITNQIRISLMMIDIGEHNEAIQFFENFLDNKDLRENYKNKGFIWSIETICYAALAHAYAELGNKEKVFEFYKITVNKLAQFSHPPQRMYGLTFVAKALQIIGEYKKAAPLICEAYEIAQYYPVGIIKPIVWIEYAIYLTKHNNDYLSALSLLDECLNSTEFSGFGYAKMMIKKLIASIYITMNMKHVALEVLEEAENLAKKFKNDHMLEKILLLKKSTI